MATDDASHGENKAFGKWCPIRVPIIPDHPLDRPENEHLRRMLLEVGRIVYERVRCNQGACTPGLHQSQVAK